MPSNKTIKGAGFVFTSVGGTLSADVKKAIVKGLEAVQENYFKQVVKNVSLHDHDLAELRKMGNPYAVGASVPKAHDDDRLVHEQSGELVGSLKKTGVMDVGAGKFSVAVTSSDPVLQYLIHGTSTMRPRRFHEKAYEEIREKLWDPIKEALGNVKSKIVLHK